ncbi:MAG: hypothetical protein K2G35_08400 [Duncaniella sp.]|nr:hypothetical protein [Duncaniella sp.]
MAIQLPRNLWAFLAVSGLLLTTSSCVDNAYDLDDIDSEYEIKVTDLTLPVKLDAFELSSVFNLDDESVIKDIDGVYAVNIDGEFHSDEVRINHVTLSVGNMSAISTNIFSYAGTDVSLPSFEVGEQALAYEITPASTPFELSGVQIDNCLRQLDVIKGEWKVDFAFSLKDINNLFRVLEFQNLKLQLPKGFKVDGYTADDKGCITIPSLAIATNGTTHYQLVVSEIDTRELPASEYSFTAGPGSSPSSLSIKSNIGVAGGYVTAVTNKTTTSTPQHVDLVITPTPSNIDINYISGKVEYRIENLNVSDLALNDLPDFLTQSGTDISLSNPQLYLSINNPLADSKLTAQAGLSLGAIRNGVVDRTVTLPSANKIVIGVNKGVDGPYDFCLSPSKPEGLPSTTTHLAFPDFGKLLSGAGLPTAIRVDFSDPKVPETYVTDFKIGQLLKAFTGKYQLVAPLSFNDGSMIVYEEKETGWNDDTLLKLTISELKLTATITNPLPFDVVMTGYPLNEDGSHVTDVTTGAPVQLVDAEGNLGFRIKAGETTDITLRTDGAFSGIDGIAYEARCVVANPGVALSPSSVIKVENIRATVSGKYVDEF